MKTYFLEWEELCPKCSGIGYIRICTPAKKCERVSCCRCRGQGYIKGRSVVQRQALLVWIILISFVVAVLFFAPCATHADEWTTQDVVLELSWEALHLVDIGQTLDIAKNPEKYRELNPIMGEHPSTETVLLYMGSCAILHPLVTWALPHKAELFDFEFNPRAIWQCVSIGMSVGCVANNFMIGISMNF